MYNFLICLVTNLFRTLIILRFMGVFFDRKQAEKKWEACTYIFFYIMTTSLYLIFHKPTINVFSNILGMFIITLVYSDTLKKKIIVVMLIYLINMLCDSIAVLSFTNHTIGKELNELIEIITLLLILMSELIVERLIAIKNRFVLLPTYVTFLLIIPLSSIIMLYVLTMERFDHRFNLIFFSFGFLTINITTFYLYNAIADSYSQKLEKDLLEQKSKAYANQLDVIMQSQDRIRDDLDYHSFELNVILGNLLENAIEAAKQTEAKILNVNLELDRGILFIHIQNSYLRKIEKSNQKFLTTKKEKWKHGFGLQNIKRVVEMHNGTMTIHEKENMFGVDIMLYMSNVK